ncbi:MAG: molybdopterin molybdotransferase MoeA [Planctomycetota bacterium]|jgi:molybdopterin molybdotransferase
MSLPDYTQVLEEALRAVEPLVETETVALRDAGGRVLAEPLTADRDLPPFDRAQMDGYALRAADFVPHRAWPVAGAVPAGAVPDVEVPAGACVAIATGAPLPAGLDTVIQHELSDRGDPVRFEVESIECGHAVHPRGADAARGDVLVAAPCLLGAHHLAIAATVGRVALNVVRRPRTVVLTSGDEVRPADGDVQPHQIRNSNAPLVSDLLRRVGAELVGATHLPDDAAATVEAVGHALREADLVVTVGGISAGERDFFPEALAHHEVRIVRRGGAIQPGKPILVGRHGDGAIVIGLPGNPVSVLACACLFAWPIVRRLLGLDPALPWRHLRLAEAVRPNARRRAFRPAILCGDDAARVPRWAGSGDLAHTAPTDGLLELPVQADPVPAGTPLRFLPWP